MKKVLIVDDSLFLRSSIKTLVDNNGFSVIGEATNGIEAISKYNELRPDIVTMDITMPELDGVGAVKGIKTINSEAKIVIVSSMGQEEMVKKAIVAGADSFIVKPFKSEKLLEVLNNL